ncbi:LOW QUALITY PROTEIN: hypothetical protein CVT26_015369 [Gymnopilus dilepis]|uniref:Uncharacterized protein n=1 Tax=Gymnopilus dilepis TaxID=231916 RepID=A0A409WD28_9AGAR|nr:LOW QUALITY PROTEIN: hypothetical protein CVT26_015369 [Gymnopilus dilepis]
MPDANFHCVGFTRGCCDTCDGVPTRNPVSNDGLPSAPMKPANVSGKRPMVPATAPTTVDHLKVGKEALISQRVSAKHLRYSLEPFAAVALLPDSMIKTLSASSIASSEYLAGGSLHVLQRLNMVAPQVQTAVRKWRLISIGVGLELSQGLEEEDSLLPTGDPKYTGLHTQTSEHLIFIPPEYVIFLQRDESMIATSTIQACKKASETRHWKEELDTADEKNQVVRKASRKKNAEKAESNLSGKAIDTGAPSLRKARGCQSKPPTRNELKTPVT